MNLYFNRIRNFISDLSQFISILDQEQCAGVYRVQTHKYYVYFYLPGQIRRPEPRDLGVIHIDYDQIEAMPDKILARLKGLHQIGRRIYGRQTVVARIDKKVALAFQEEHHIQVALPGKYRYGLYHQGELVSVAIFSGGRHMRDQDKEYRSFELLRFCHKGDTIVVGGISKLIKAFIADFNPQDIMTYADLDWTQESSLQTIGFQVIGLLPPQKYYIVQGVRQFLKPTDSEPFYTVENLGSLKLKRLI